MSRATPSYQHLYLELPGAPPPVFQLTLLQITWSPSLRICARLMSSLGAGQDQHRALRGLGL